MVVLNIEPTTFNILSDLIGLATKLILLQGIVLAYRWFLSIHVKNGHFIPVDDLATIPSDLCAALRFAWSLGPKSIAMIFLVILLFLADFSHVFSDMDLRFRTVNTAGDSLPVLDIERFNDKFSYRTVGDPINFRTYDQNHLKNFPVYRFISAVDSIAQGFSPFVWLNPSQLYPPKHGGEVPIKYRYMNGESAITFSSDERNTQTGSSSKRRRDRPLAFMPRYIPLNCTSDIMQTFEEQFHLAFEDIPAGTTTPDGLTKEQWELFNVPFTNEARVPECDFSQTRSSGIYGDSTKGVSVNEYARFLRDDNEKVKVMIGGVYDSTFLLPHGARELARDRYDWQKGRAVTGITKIMVGNGLEIELDDAKMKMAYSGRDTWSFNIFTQVEPGVGHNAWANAWAGDDSVQYTFVNKVKGICPDKPNDDPFPARPRKPGFDEECLVIFTADCKEQFIEDKLAIPYDLLYPNPEDEPASTECVAGSVEIIWGENFNIDESTIAAVAGVYGRDGGQMSSRSFDGRAFLTINSIFAARFSLAMLSTKLSNREVVKPQIGFVWTLFTILPIIIGSIVTLISCITRRSNRHIPISSKDVLILGKEQPDMLPCRTNMTDAFPNKKKFHGAKYGVFKKEEDNVSEAESSKKQQGTYTGLGGFTGVSEDSSPVTIDAFPIPIPGGTETDSPAVATSPIEQSGEGPIQYSTLPTAPPRNYNEV